MNVNFELSIVDDELERRAELAIKKALDEKLKKDIERRLRDYEYSDIIHDFVKQELEYDIKRKAECAIGDWYRYSRFGKPEEIDERWLKAFYHGVACARMEESILDSEDLMNELLEKAGNNLAHSIRFSPARVKKIAEALKTAYRKEEVDNE